MMSICQQHIHGMGFSNPSPQPSLSNFSASPIYYRWWLQNKQSASVTARRSNTQAFQALATANVSSGKNSSGKKVIMVDPLEAKRLAAKQMQELQAREKFRRRRQIEAINGAWAMIGLTAGLVIEGHTGNSILTQLAGYWSIITSFVAP